MKKIYILGLLLGVMGLNAQTVIFSQPTTTTNGIVADALANGNFVATADDFTLASQSTITKISISGFQSAGTLETTVGTGVMLYIYANAAGSPAGIPNNPAVAPIAAINIAKGAPGYGLVKSGTSNYTYNIDVTAALSSPLVLQANTVYWLVFAAKTNLTAYTAGPRFNWFAGQINANPAKLVDPSDAFGAGATDWVDIFDLTDTAALNGLAFSIEGQTTTLGVTEVTHSQDLQVYPNPVKDVLKFKFGNNLKSEGIDIFDMNGRVVTSIGNSKDVNEVNVSSYPKGSYILKVKANDGKVYVQKIIKE